MIPSRWSAFAFVISIVAVAASADVPVTFAPPPVDLPAFPMRADVAPAAVEVSSADEALGILRDAYAANDLPRFEAALTSANAFADSMPLGDARNAFRRAILVYEDVDAVWSFAATDPAGSFFNDDSLPGLRDRLRAYDGFEAFIDQYRVSDRRGDVFYPTAETRAFLLRQLQTPVTVRVARAERPLVRRSAPLSPAQAGVNEVVGEAPRAVAQPAVAETAPVVAAPTVTADALAADMDNAADPPVAPLHAELIDAETAQPLIFVVLALIAGVLTLALRAPEDDAAETPAVPQLVLAEEIEDDEPLTVRRPA